MKPFAIATLLMLSTFAASAEPVYRCGSSYQQTPCAGAKLVDTDDSRTAAQWAEAKAVVAEERRLGHEMAAERRAIESRASTVPASLSAPRVVTVVRPGTTVAALHRPKVKQRRYTALTRDGEFTAVVPRAKPH